MFNKVQNKLFIETNWKDEFTVGEILVIECYEILDPDTHTEIYDDHFLKRYVTALFKKQWGNRSYEDNWRRSDKSSVIVLAVKIRARI